MPKFFRLHKLSIEGIRSFADNSSIEFPKTGLLLINGKNKDTGGSSGSGKSTIPMAINLPLDCCPFSLTTLQSFYTENPVKVELEIFRDGDEYPIKLTKGEESSYTQILTMPISGAKAVKSAVKSRITHLDSELLGVLTYRPQRTPGIFLSMSDSEKKDFLNKVLKLDLFEKAISDQETRLKTKEDNLKSILLSHTSKRELLNSTVVYRALLRPEEDPFLNVAKLHQAELVSQIKQLKLLYDEQKQKEEQELDSKCYELTKDIPYIQSLIEDQYIRLASFDGIDKTNLEKLLSAINVKKSELEQVVRQDQLDNNNRVSKLNTIAATIQDLTDQINDINSLIPRLNQLKEENLSLSKNICPTCIRTWDNAIDKIAINNTAINNIEEELTKVYILDTEIENKRIEMGPYLACITNAKVFELENSINKLSTELEIEKVNLKSNIDNKKSQASLEIETNKLKIKQIQQQADNLRSNYIIQISESKKIANEIIQLERDLDVKSKEIEQLIAQVRMNFTYNNIERRREEESQKSYNQRLDSFKEIDRQKNVAEIDFKNEEDYLEVIGRGGFLGSIFDEILNEISVETNRILAEVPNTSDCSLWFDSSKSTQKGIIKKTITPIVSMNGNEGPYKAMLSGGKIAALELAVDLALGEVISQRTGIRPGWLILDEAFEGLGPIEKEGCLQILSKYAENKLVIVIDHSSEFKEFFSKEITVHHENGRSWIENDT